MIVVFDVYVAVYICDDIGDDVGAGTGDDVGVDIDDDTCVDVVCVFCFDDRLRSLLLVPYSPIIMSYAFGCDCL